MKKLRMVKVLVERRNDKKQMLRNKICNNPSGAACSYTRPACNNRFINARNGSDRASIVVQSSGTCANEKLFCNPADSLQWMPGERVSRSEEMGFRVSRVTSCTMEPMIYEHWRKWLLSRAIEVQETRRSDGSMIELGFKKSQESSKRKKVK